MSTTRVVITGARGLIGWHAHARLHARNCAAEFSGNPKPFDIVALGHEEFDDNKTLAAALHDADMVLHFAGVNRALEEKVETGNPDIANLLVKALADVGAAPYIVYANSTHSVSDSPYGRSKSRANEILSAFSNRYTNMILPHIFGECARPFYNNVTATIIAQLLSNESVSVNPDGRVDLLHAGAAAEIAIQAALNGDVGEITPESHSISVPDLYEKLKEFHWCYENNIYPDLTDQFTIELFNSYRAATYPDQWPRAMQLHTDSRGSLFEAVKGGGGGQTFLSTTLPGVTRGDHFHIGKVERFLVLQGDAIIRIRKVLSNKVWEYHLSGDSPSVVDMPTLHTHSIENVGETNLTTLFWTHELFDPNNPDTYLDRVIV